MLEHPVGAPRRTLPRVLLAALGFVLLGLGPRPAAAQDASISALALNLKGFWDVPDTPNGIDWKRRYARIATWMKVEGKVPDVIGIVEFSGWQNCFINFKPTNEYDYAGLDHLLAEIRYYTGIEYRIAYLTGKTGSWGIVPNCHAYFSHVLLYNPNRLTNVTRRALASTRLLGHEDGTDAARRPHLRRSLPLCNRGPGLQRIPHLSQLIDGPWEIEKCDGATPTGPAWAVLTKDGGGVMATAARFELKAAPGKTVDVFVTHPREATGAQLTSWLITHLEPLVGSALRYPPLVLGDFNKAAGGWDPRLEVARLGGPGEPVGVFAGLPTSFPSQCKARVAELGTVPRLEQAGDVVASSSCTQACVAERSANQADGVPLATCERMYQSCLADCSSGVRQYDELCPGGSEKLISDHCGVYVRLEPDGPDACALRQAFIDYPPQVAPGQSYSMTAVPAGGEPNYTYLWQGLSGYPNGATTAKVDARAGVNGTTQEWTVQVIASKGQTASNSVKVKAVSTSTPPPKLPPGAVEP